MNRRSFLGMLASTFAAIAVPLPFRPSVKWDRADWGVGPCDILADIAAMRRQIMEQTGMRPTVFVGSKGLIKRMKEAVGTDGIEWRKTR
jgi:hypothetical protein